MPFNFGTQSWFESLTGFVEEHPDQVRENLILNDNAFSSKVNGRSFICGKLEIPTLKELRERVGELPTGNAKLQLQEIVGDVKNLHQDQANEGALFQAASQFNLLEMVSPHVIPERGITIYENDHTQGPACAISAGAGTIYRNYFAQVNGKIGQTKDNQIDCLSDIGQALGNDNNRLWEMRNGYALATLSGLKEINEHLSTLTEDELDQIREKLRIGMQWDTEVTINNRGFLVSQAYCSAVPVDYSDHPSELWESFARLILESSYEAVFASAVINATKTGSYRLFLTQIGGGVFGNEDEWIFNGIERALEKYQHYPLEVFMVSYGHSIPSKQAFIHRWNQNH